jgi:hypothetical protein
MSVSPPPLLSRVVRVSRRNKIDFLVRLLPDLRRVLVGVEPGKVYRVGV